MGVGHASEGERPFCAQAEGRDFIGWPVRRWVCVEGHPLISRKRAVVSSGWRKSRPYEATQSMGKSVIAGFHLLKVRHEVDRSDGIEPNIRNRGWPSDMACVPRTGWSLLVQASNIVVPQSQPGEHVLTPCGDGWLIGQILQFIGVFLQVGHQRWDQPILLPLGR